MDADGEKHGFEKTLRLLWESAPSPARGPKPKLTRDQIVEAAVALADALGLEALSMRAVAKALGVGTMSLYRYVPSKDSLVALMFDTVLLGAPRADELPGDWRAKLEAVARLDLAFYVSHPWVLEISHTRPPLGPGTFDAYESLLKAIDGSGLTKAELTPAVLAISSYVRGAAQAELTRARTVRDSGVTDEQWWTERNAFWDRYFDPERYPTITAIYNARGYENAPDDFDFGLQRLLDGLEALIASRAGDEP